jgi:hypothetical protein
MKTYGRVDVWIHVFLTSALVGGEWSASLHLRLTPEKKAHGIIWTGGWVGPRGSLDDKKWKFFTLPGLELRPFGRSAQSQLLYQRRYRVPRYIWDFFVLHYFYCHTFSALFIVHSFNDDVLENSIV